MHKLQIELRKLAKPEKIPIYKNFFKTGEGEYGEGDEFIGVTVPDSRKVARANIDISYEDLSEVVEEIKYEMNAELNNISESKKLLRNYARGRIATCEDILVRIKSKINKKWEPKQKI